MCFLQDRNAYKKLCQPHRARLLVGLIIKFMIQFRDYIVQLSWNKQHVLLPFVGEVASLGKKVSLFGTLKQGNQMTSGQARLVSEINIHNYCNTRPYISHNLVQSVCICSNRCNSYKRKRSVLCKTYYYMIVCNR